MTDFVNMDGAKIQQITTDLSVLYEIKLRQINMSQFKDKGSVRNKFMLLPSELSLKYYIPWRQVFCGKCIDASVMQQTCSAQIKQYNMTKQNNKM